MFIYFYNKYFKNKNKILNFEENNKEKNIIIINDNNEKSDNIINPILVNRELIKRTSYLKNKIINIVNYENNNKILNDKLDYKLNNKIDDGEENINDISTDKNNKILNDKLYYELNNNTDDEEEIIDNISTDENNKTVNKILNDKLYYELNNNTDDGEEIIDDILTDENNKIVNKILVNDNNLLTAIKCLFHEFRGPLNNVTLGIDILSELIDKNNKNDEIIENINESINFILISITTFLDKKTFLDPNNDNKINLIYNPFNLIELIRRVQKLFIFIIEQKKINIELIMTGTLNENILGDKYQLEHVFYNLLSNAIKFSNNNSKIIIIIDVLLTTINDQKLSIYIFDENKYIPKIIKQKLFNKYNTSNKNIGTGLGLYLSKKIIELHSGTINHYYINKNKNNYEFDDEINDTNKLDIIGNVFKIDLTFNYIIDKNIISTEIVSNCSNKLKYNTNIKKICIVDDSTISTKLLIKLIKFIINIEDIIEAVNGLDAILKIHDILNNISIIFIDNIMPKIDGITTTNIIRKLGFKNIIIGITGNDDNEDINNFYANGADFIFIKPCNRAKLIMLFNFIDNYSYISLSPNKKIIEKNNVLHWC
jgi:signal transduction histidine kinase